MRDIKADNEYLQRKFAEKNQEYEKLIYTISHDFRTPILNIQGFSKEIEKSINSLSPLIKNDTSKADIQKIINEDIPTYFNYIYLSINKIEKQINALLKISRLGREELKKEKIDLKEIIKDIIISCKLKIDESNVSVIGETTFLGDKSLLSELFLQLIDNSIKYSDKEFCILIESKEKDGSVEIIYKDNGIGIIEKNLANIFDVFFQENKNNIGEGIGLSIVKKIIELHNAQISVESAEGSGTTFCMKFPLISLDDEKV